MSTGNRPAMRPWTFRVLWALVCVALAIFYAVAAHEHGVRVNTSKARGDQSGYLWDAQHVYANWHGRQPPALIGERNRMPLYAGYLALFYHRGLTDDVFFEIAKTANLLLSLALIAAIGLLVRRRLPPHAAWNLVGIVAFGYFIYKAGYAQSELLFYFLLFVTFLAVWPLVDGAAGWRAVRLAVMAGAAAGLAHLTKAAMLPFVGLVLLALLLRAGGPRVFRGPDAARPRGALQPIAAAVLFALSFLAVVSPYIVTSRQVFGHYFYNVNSTFYVWYDDWPHASVGTRLHNDSLGWPTLPASELPGPVRYWREHSLGQIAARLVGGFRDMAWTSYRTLGFLPYLVLCGGAAAWAALSQPRAFRELVGRHATLAAFLGSYAAVYLLATAFYHPISGTGTGRFLAAHLTPLFFALLLFVSRCSPAPAGWRVASREIPFDGVQVLLTVVLSLDIAFRVWPRLMTTYGGF